MQVFIKKKVITFSSSTLSTISRFGTLAAQHTTTHKKTQENTTNPEFQNQQRQQMNHTQ